MLVRHSNFERLPFVLAVITWVFFVTHLQAAAQDREEESEELRQNAPGLARLETAGVKPFADVTTEIWGNVAGGVQPEAWWNQLVNFGLEVDTEKLAGWSGGKFVAQVHWVANSRRNGSLAESIGAVNSASGIMASDQVRVFNLHYQQSWEDKWLVKVGQIAVDDDFMLSSYTGLFANSAFGAMPSQVGNRLAGCCGFSAPFPMYPVAGPGLFLQVRPSESLYLQGGVYDGVPGHDRPDNHGFDWAGQSHWEAGLLFEGGYNYKLLNRDATLRVGMSHHTGKLESFSPGGEPQSDTRQAVPNFYAVQDVALLRGDEGRTLLGAFARAGMTTSPAQSMVGAYADAGLNWFGPIPGRENDIAGLALSYSRFGKNFRISTGVNDVPVDQTTVEWAYKAQVTRSVSLQADVQLLVHPLGAGATETGQETAVVVGLRGQVQF